MEASDNRIEHLENEIAQKDAKIRELTAILDRRKARFAVLSEETAEMKVEILEIKREHTEMHDIMAYQGIELGRLRDLLNVLSADRIELQEKQIAEMDKRIAEMGEWLSERNDKYRLVTDKINEKINRIAELERDLAAAKAEFEVIRQDGICEVCKFGDNAPPDCRECCCFVWRGAREGE